MEHMRPNTLGTEENLLRTLVDQLPAMIAYWDATRHCRFANRAYEQWFGISPERLLGMHIRELLGPIYELNRPYIDAALRGEPQEFEREIPNPAGGPARQSLANYIPHVVGGTVRGFFVLVTEVSEVKRAQLALRESEERFRLTLEEAPIGMALVALDGRLMRVNRAFSELLGYTASELTALTFHSISHPEDLDADLALAGQLARGEIPRYQLEKRYIRKDGKVIVALLSGSVLRDPTGAPIHFIAQVQDITSSKRHERDQRFLAEVGPALASSLDYEETLSRIAEMSVKDHADVCIVDVADEGDVRRLNVASRDDATSAAADTLMRVDHTRPHLLRQVLETHRAVLLQDPSEETLRSVSQSEEHWAALHSLNVRSFLGVPLLAQGKLLGAIAWLSSDPARTYGSSDVHLAEELARRAALSIQNAQLYRAAQRAARARDDVLAVVAHDLRNPLNTILMQASLLRHRGAGEVRPPPPDRCDCARSIERAAQRMKVLIRDLLDVTRMESGRLSVHPSRLSAASVLGDAVEAQSPLAAAARLELRCEAIDEAVEVWADRDRVLQVFENLIGNALKFTAPTGWIRVGATAQADEVRFCVQDNGRGIPADELPHLFDRFWQGRAGREGGAGLGLPIAKGLIESHGGRMWVESAPGRGTTFFFTLRRAPGPTPLGATDLTSACRAFCSPPAPSGS